MEFSLFSELGESRYCYRCIRETVWHACLDSLDLKALTRGLFTMPDFKLFHLGIVLGKYEYLAVSQFIRMTWYLCWWVTHVQLDAGLSKMMGTATRPFTILCIRMRCRSFLLSSIDFHISSSIRVVTLTSLPLRLRALMIWAAHQETISRWSVSLLTCGFHTVQLYSRVDLIRVK